MGELTQDPGPAQQPVEYLSHKLKTTAKGWHLCLTAMAAVALLEPEAFKLI